MLWKGVPVIFVQLLTYWYTHLYKLAMWSIDLIINHYFIFVISIGGNRSDNRFKIISKFFSNIYITRAAIYSTSWFKIGGAESLGVIKGKCPRSLTLPSTDISMSICLDNRSMSVCLDHLFLTWQIYVYMLKLSVWDKQSNKSSKPCLQFQAI